MPQCFLIVPINVTITTDSSNPTHSITSDIILTCTVRLIEISESIQQIILNTSWIGPPPNLTRITNDSMQLDIDRENYRHTMYNGRATVKSFSRENSGNYTCIATVEIQERSMFPYLNNTRVVATKQITTGNGYVDSRVMFTNKLLYNNRSFHHTQ